MSELAKIEAKDVLSGTMKAKRSGKAPPQEDVAIYKMAESGVPFTTIASLQNVSLQDVKTSIRRVEKFIASGVAVDVVAIKAQQHMRLEALYDVTVKAFQETSGPVKTTRRKLGTDGTVVEEVITEKEHAGDPRFLNTAMKALEAQRDLWPGVSAPRATSITNADGTDDPHLTVEMLNQMDIAELEVLNQARELVEAKFVENTSS